jgi:hypothetical protein
MNTEFKKSMFLKIVLFVFLSSIYVCSSVVPFYNPKHHHYVNIEDASLSNVEVDIHVDVSSSGVNDMDQQNVIYKKIYININIYIYIYI